MNNGITVQDCSAPAEAVGYSSCCTVQSFWRSGSSASSCGEHTGEPATHSRAAAREPAIVSSSSEEINEQRQRIAWTARTEGPGCQRQQAFPSPSVCSSAAPASPSRNLRWYDCWPSSGVGAHEAAAGRCVCLRQLVHVLHAECQGQATSRPVHRLRRGACGRGQDEGRHQDQDEALFYKAEGHWAVATQLGSLWQLRLRSLYSNMCLHTGCDQISADNCCAGVRC